MAIEITPSNAKDPVRIPGSHPSSGKAVSCEIPSAKLRGGVDDDKMKNQAPDSGQAWWKKDSEVKYHKYS